jgi:DNA-directed RNA polymerase subunit RPC12/RpoP
VYVCVECGATYTARSGLERHWEDERHSPEHIQRERLRQSRKNEGWLLPEEDGR